MESTIIRLQNTFQGYFSEVEMRNCHRNLVLVFGAFDPPTQSNEDELKEVVQNQAKAMHFKVISSKSDNHSQQISSALTFTAFRRYD